MALSDILIRIKADSSAFEAEMSKTNKALNQVFAASNKATSGFAALGSRMTSIGSTMTMGITLPLAAFSAATVKTAADMEALKAGLAATTKESGSLEKQLARLQEVAKLPGLGLKEAIQGSTSLQAAGFSAQLAERSLKAFGNALATVGKGKAELDGVTLALSQIASKGKISAEEINQLAERVPQIRVAMKDAFGTADTEVLQKAGIGAEEFVTRVVVQLEKLKQVTGGTKNSFENLSDTLTQAGDRIGQKLLPTVNAMIPQIEKLVTLGADLVDQFTKLPAPVQTATLAITGLIAAAGPVSYVLGKFLESASILRTALVATTSGLKALAGTFSLAGAAAAAGAVGVGLFMKWLIDNGGKPVDTTGEAIKRLNERVGTGTPAAFGSASESILGYMRVMAPANEETKATEALHLGAATAIEKHAKAMETAKLPSADLLALFERFKDATQAKQEQISKLADIMGRYGVVTADAALKAARSLDILFQSYRQLSDAPDLGNLNSIDFSKLPKAPEAGLPGPGGFEEYQRGGRNIGPEGMLTREQADAIKERYKQVGKAGQAAMRQVSTIVTDLSRGIAGVIFEGGKLGDMLQKVAKQAGQAIVRELIEGALTKLSKKLLDVGGIFGTVFGGGTGVVKSAASGAGSAAGGLSGMLGGGGGGAASAVGGVASAGITGVISAVSGVVSAVSGVIGNFQFMAMNKTLDLIEHEVRYSQIHLLNTLNKANEFWPYMKSVWESLIRMETAGGFGGGGGTVNVSMAGAYLMSDAQMGDFADRLARFLKARGV